MSRSTECKHKPIPEIENKLSWLWS